MFCRSPANPKILIYVVTLLNVCFGSFNFYIDTNEVQRLLGLNAELFYVRNGVINEQASNFILSVPYKHNVFYFTWESLEEKPLNYKVKVDSPEQVVLEKPVLNISATGLMPKGSQMFSVDIPCSGKQSGQSDILVSVTITLPSNNITNINIHRRKTCIETDVKANNILSDSESVNPGPAKMFYFAISCAVGFLFFFLVFLTSFYIRRKKFKKVSDNNIDQSQSTFLHSSRNPTAISSYGSFRRAPSYSLLEDRPKDIQERISDLTIQRCRVCLKSVLLEGTFGRVYQGTYTKDNGSVESVLIKTVTDHASQIQISLLLQEGMSMYSINHKNILSILGVSFEENTAPFLLYPFRDFKNLKIFLQKCKLCSEGVAHTLTTQEIVDMALQITGAMLYLHKRHLLHKDLAARNCVVDEKLKIQITDNALSRDLFPADYHCLGDNENRPIKWLAIESLISKTFSPQSDVWSFGVLLWELTSLAQQPYVEIDPFEMAAYLKDGYRLTQPINCPDELFAVIAYCWAMNPEDRPTFLQLKVCLSEFYSQLTQYV
ncbi:tyrosine-protein kinase Dnt isoform X2 [Agrilus planipennis]|uniref:receptor protein-tyrosine kinase n=1 Tax=Agrilus planipennis TaxID=224129 RepID=A0A1W4WYR6_AGRPL|nr:tyrosine-protein kinase Dnt isoform X2 [Agrilus planipennis]